MKTTRVNSSPPITIASEFAWEMLERFLETLNILELSDVLCDLELAVFEIMEAEKKDELDIIKTPSILGVPVLCFYQGSPQRLQDIMARIAPKTGRPLKNFLKNEIDTPLPSRSK